MNISFPKKVFYLKVQEMCELQQEVANFFKEYLTLFYPFYSQIMKAQTLVKNDSD